MHSLSYEACTPSMGYLIWVMTRSLAGGRAEAMALPAWVKPQLTKLVDQAPEGPEFRAHEKANAASA